MSTQPPEGLAQMQLALEAEAAYQPRYVAYARAHGRSPEVQAAQDRVEHPGGCMVGYILWIGDRWREYRSAAGWRPGAPADHAGFDAWLEARTT